MKIHKILVLGSFIAFAAGCKNSSRLGIDPISNRRAASHIADSFSAVSNLVAQADLGVDQAHVEIKKSALEKEFLFSTNIISQTPTPSFQSLQSRVVSFIFRDNKVYLIDVTGNNRVGFDNIPQNLLLAQFDIITDKPDSLVIDFNAGMKKIFVAGDWYASDDGRSAPDFTLPTAKVDLSYLDEVSMKNESLFIRQIAQLESVSAKNEVTSVPVEVRYQIKAYLPDTTFVPLKSPGFTKVGYFEANPLLLKDGTAITYAAKWDKRKPIIFSVSANTPVKYRDLVKNGILYWNKILGGTAIQVEQLTDTAITAPSFNKNIIQWVDYDGAGGAFADAQVDPRSGQVLSAQIFIPSAFTESLVPKRVRLNARQKLMQLRVGLKGISSGRMCARDMNRDLATMDLSEITPEALDKAMRDYVYEVIAHEMGHVLGLRHNFAGSLAANYDWDQRKEFVMSYYKNKQAPVFVDGTDVIGSSSVMEYSRFEESSWNGDRMQKPGSSALEYDQMAMKYLYLGIAIPEVRPAFCTDSHIETYVDCNTTDAGRSVVSASSGAYQFNLNTLAARVINFYISKSKYADDANVTLIPVSEVDLNAKSIAATYGIDFAKFISLMKTGQKFIKVRSAQMPILTPDLPAIRIAENSYLQAEVNRLGGLTKLTATLPADFDVQLQQNFSALLSNPFYNSGLGRDGKPYAFTTDEIAVMKKQFALFSVQVKNELTLNQIKAMSGENFSFEQSYGQAAAEEKVNWADSDLATQLATINLAHFNYYALTKASGKINAEVGFKDGSRTKVELPTYLFSQDVRVASARLFSNIGAIDWAYFEKQQASELMANEISILGNEEQIDKSTLSKDALKWLLQNKQVESKLE